MEKEDQGIRHDITNAILFGNDNKEGAVYSRCTREDIWKYEMNNMLKNAKTYEDFNVIGLKINYAIDKKLNIKVIDYQFKAAKKMTEISGKLEEKTIK